MEQLYHVEGLVNRDFVGQITYTICLERPYRSMDIAFTFDQQRFSREDLSEELIADVQRQCLEKYGLTYSREETERVILGDMKTEIHTLLTLNDTFIGCIHRQLTERHMHYDGEEATEGCIPTPVFEGVLKVTVLVFNVIKDRTRYTLSVSGEPCEREGETAC
ncbi:MAG: hypothetical protein IJ083_03385 [Clostridia bacterium]|nr:hypothetical protein [Clostridia bacterium]